MIEQKNTPEYFHEDEIDLRELWATVMRYKKHIIAFTAVVTFAALVYALSIPNSYKSYTLLSPQEQSGQSVGGGLAALAGMAGVSLGGGTVDAGTSLQAILKDYSFNKTVIEKHGLMTKVSELSQRENMIFAFGFSGFYALLRGGEVEYDSVDAQLYDAYKQLKGILSLASDSKTGALTLSATTNDRSLAKELVDIYLIELTDYLKTREVEEISNKIKFYKQELAMTQDVELKMQIANLLSSLVQKRVLSNASQYYVINQLIPPTVAHIKDKVGPKRSLILVLSMILSLMIGVFGAFFKEFLAKNASSRNS